jgi:hypothetical protein
MLQCSHLGHPQSDRLKFLETKNWLIADWTACVKIYLFISIFSFRRVNYIFHKLSQNTKHVQFWLCMSPWCSFIQNGYYVHFSCIFLGAPTCSHVAETAQGLKGRVLRKKFLLPIKSWIFTFIRLFFAHGYVGCQLQCDNYNLNVKFFILFKKFYKVYSVEVLSQDPRQ